MTEIIKIAHIATSYQSIITILSPKLRVQDKFADLDITAISSSPEIDYGCAPAVKHIQVEMARSIRVLADLRSIWQLYKVLKGGRFDIVHSHSAKAGSIATISAKMAAVPLIYHTYHGLPFYQGQDRKSYFFYRYLEKIICKFRNHVFSQNKRDMFECIKLMGSTNKVSYEGNGIDVERVNEYAKEQLQKALEDFPRKGIKLVLMSRLEPVKRVDDFFKVVDNLRRKGIEVSSVVAGIGFLEKQLREELAKMGLCDCINMVGFSNCPYGLIAASDIVILCSVKEGIPRSIMEAMALKKPVVATDVLGTQELVVDGQTGFLVRLGDIDQMADKIRILASDSSLRAKMGAAGFGRVKEDFNDEIIANHLRDFYIKEMIEKRVV